MLEYLYAHCPEENGILIISHIRTWRPILPFHVGICLLYPSQALQKSIFLVQLCNGMILFAKLAV